MVPNHQPVVAKKGPEDPSRKIVQSTPFRTCRQRHAVLAEVAAATDVRDGEHHLGAAAPEIWRSKWLGNPDGKLPINSL